MAKNEGFDNQGLISTQQILEILLKVFKVVKIDSDKRKNLERKIQRDFKAKYNSFAVKIKGSKKTYHYPKEIVEEYVYDEHTIRYFQRVFKSKYYKPNKLLIAEELQELDEKKQELYSLWEEVGLSKEEGNILQVDQITRKEYLSVDELQQLKKKGMVLRDTLTDEEKEHLELYERHLATSQAEEEQINKLFKEKKIEIMITALFNQSFTLDEDLLKEDISNFVHCGKYDADLKELSIDDETTHKQSASIRRSFERLQKESSYYKKKQ